MAAMASLLALGFGRRGQAVAPPEVAPARGPATWRERWAGVFGDVRAAITEGRVLAIAAGVVFYTLLALFPGIAAIVSLYGLYADPVTITEHLRNAAMFLPGGAIDVVGDEIKRIAAQGRGTLSATFAVGLVVSLWSASGGVKAMFDALNVVYGVEERRSFVRVNAIALAFVVGGTIFVLLALAGLVALPIIEHFFGVSEGTKWTVVLIEWPLMFVIAALGIALLYCFGPSLPREQREWHWITWGSAIATIAWIIASALFSWYAANFGSYNKTYGSLGAVIGFMTWMWISAIVILIGADIDAALARRK
jgi:membrane protein